MNAQSRIPTVDFLNHVKERLIQDETKDVEMSRARYIVDMSAATTATSLITYRVSPADLLPKSSSSSSPFPQLLQLDPILEPPANLLRPFAMSSSRFL